MNQLDELQGAVAMKYLDEYRDREAAGKLADAIARTVTRPWTIMEVCGGQTHTIVKYGIDDILPERNRAGARSRLSRCASRRWR